MKINEKESFALQFTDYQAIIIEIRENMGKIIEKNYEYERIKNTFASEKM